MPATATGALLCAVAILCAAAPSPGRDGSASERGVTAEMRGCASTPTGSPQTGDARRLWDGHRAARALGSPARRIDAQLRALLSGDAIATKRSGKILLAIGGLAQLAAATETPAASALRSFLARWPDAESASIALSPGPATVVAATASPSPPQHRRRWWGRPSQSELLANARAELATELELSATTRAVTLSNSLSRSAGDDVEEALEAAERWARLYARAALAGRIALIACALSAATVCAVILAVARRSTLRFRACAMQAERRASDRETQAKSLKAAVANARARAAAGALSLAGANALVSQTETALRNARRRAAVAEGTAKEAKAKARAEVEAVVRAAAEVTWSTEKQLQQLRADLAAERDAACSARAAAARAAALDTARAEARVARRESAVAGAHAARLLASGAGLACDEGGKTPAPPLSSFSPGSSLSMSSAGATSSARVRRLRRGQTPSPPSSPLLSPAILGSRDVNVGGSWPWPAIGPAAQDALARAGAAEARMALAEAAETAARQVIQALVI